MSLVGLVGRSFVFFVVQKSGFLTSIFSFFFRLERGWDAVGWYHKSRQASAPRFLTVATDTGLDEG